MQHVLSNRHMALVRSIGVVTAAVALLIPVVAQACAVCWGSSADQPFSRGMHWGILFLMAMPFTIVGLIGGWLVYRYKHPCRMDLQELAGGQVHSTTQPIQKESGA